MMQSRVLFFLGIVFSGVGAVLIGVFYASRSSSPHFSAGLRPALYHIITSRDSFLVSSDTSSLAGSETLRSIRDGFVARGESFVEADLQRMVVTLYADGASARIFPILSKGRDGSAWETPSGSYSVLQKEVSHFSSIGHVWMPWSLQFYGNFFIHGWPHYESGESVPVSYSGGCIRLSTIHAKEVYDFVKKGTPILVFDEGDALDISKSVERRGSVEVPPPSLSAEAAFVADLKSGETLYNKKADFPLPIASLAKLMTATVASELIYLERGITLTPSMLTAQVQSYQFVPGSRYQAYELFYPLLMLSSNGAADALAHFLNPSVFVDQMNVKARALSMTTAHFADPSGVLEGNIASLRDIAKLMHYIRSKRNFILDLTRGTPYLSFGETPLARVSNYNEFVKHPALIGMKNGESTAARQTLAALFRFYDSEKVPHEVFVGVLGSMDRKGDVEKLLQWTMGQFDLQ